MFKNMSHVTTGHVSQVNAKSYHQHAGVAVNATNLEINAEVYHHHDHHAATDALNKLCDHIAVGAMQNSDDRVDAPRCHEDTREAVQEDILSCLAEGDQQGGLVWLTGPAGAGKTAIMGTICDRLKEKERLAGTFYFSSHKGSATRMSKRYLITTLAYQLQRHPALKERIWPGMMLGIEQDPALFEMSLKEQFEVLILQPLRNSSSPPISGPPLAIAVDGVDECGEDRYDDPNRSREKDQIEVLTVLLQASNDPAFPCRIIIASRPETWIRRFLEEAASGVVEIFLDDKYSPDTDITLFLKSKFSELGRRYGYDPATWPEEEDIEKLVTDASGQFVYAATVIRFIDSAWPLPKHQLEIVLKVRPPSGTLPFCTLDALYTAILESSPSPSDTVLWLKAAQHMAKYGFRLRTYRCSAWTLD